MRKSRRLKREIPLTDKYASLSEETIDWYRSLKNKDITSLQLRRSSSAFPQHFVIVTLGDQSTYRFQRPRSFYHNLFKQSHQSEIDDTVERASNADMESKCLIKITFLPKSEAKLSIVLAGCRGIRAVNKNHKIIADNEFFAVALITTIARWHLPQYNVTDQNSTPVEELWKHVHSFTNLTKESFWEDTVAAHTRSTTRALVCHVAREVIINNLRLELSPNRLPWNPIAISAIAWLEVLAERQETSELAHWDSIWNNTWDKHWDTSFTKSFNLKRIAEAVGFIPKIVTDGRVSGGIAGRVPTKIHMGNGDEAKRIQQNREIPISIPQITVSVPKTEAIDSNSVEAGISPITPHNGSHNWMSEPSKTGKVNHNKQTDNAMYSAVLLGKWCPFRYPHQDSLWLPAWQVAAEMAWAETWTKAQRHGKAIAQSTIKTPGKVPTNSEIKEILEQKDTEGPLEALSKTVFKGISAPKENTRSAIDGPVRQKSRSTSLLPNSIPQSIQANLGAEENTITRHSSQKRRIKYNEKEEPVRNITGRSNTSKGKDQPSPETTHRLRNIVREKLIFNIRMGLEGQRERFESACIRRAKMSFPAMTPDLKDLDRRANDALEEARQVPNTPEFDLDRTANRAWRRAKETAGSLAMQSITRSQDRPAPPGWVKGFKATWEEAWRSAWKEAWLDAWERAHEDATIRGIETGVKGVADGLYLRSRNDRSDFESHPSFTSFKQDLSEESTYLGSLQKTHSMFKELNHMHDKLLNALPAAHDDIMEIWVSVHNKTSFFGDRLEPEAPANNEIKRLSHDQLQQHIKGIAEAKFDDNMVAQDVFHQAFAQVWEKTCQNHEKLAQVLTPKDNPTTEDRPHITLLEPQPE